MSEPAPTPPTSPFVVLVSGTHSTGKETLAFSLSKSLGCSWIKAEAAHFSAAIAARSQSKKGFDYSSVFGRIWLSKLQRLDFSPEGSTIISCYAMRKGDRDAIREAMQTLAVRPLFVILHITEETLSGRTLGAEEPELAKRIMGNKIADIQEPLAEELERDVMLVDSMRDMDTVFGEVREGITRWASTPQI
jgi:gluconate kinase